MIDKILADVNSLLEPYHFCEWHEVECWTKIEVHIRLMERLITDMNDKIRSYVFSSVVEEIRYFKEVQPLIIKEYIFITTLKRFYNLASPMDLEQPKTYKKEISALRDFINTEKEFYNYIKKTHTYNDERYFRRLSDSGAVPTLYSLNADLESSCSHGLLLAKITACEKLVGFYTRKLNRLKAPFQAEQPKETLPLEWKANKVDAVELVYALYYYGAVDTDKCTVQELAKQFGELFQIQITEQLYREYIDIKRRKIEPARFLVKLLNHFRNRVEEEYT